jgi:hypothetical protein
MRVQLVVEGFREGLSVNGLGDGECKDEQLHSHAMQRVYRALTSLMIEEPAGWYYTAPRPDHRRMRASVLIAALLLSSCASHAPLDAEAISRRRGFMSLLTVILRAAGWVAARI